MGREGAHCVLAKAILARPEAQDADLVSGMKIQSISRGMSQHIMLDAVKALNQAKLLSKATLKELERWMGRFKNQDDKFKKRLTDFRTQAPKT
jgi:hypothetical protein